VRRREVVERLGRLAALDRREEARHRERREDTDDHHDHGELDEREAADPPLVLHLHFECSSEIPPVGTPHGAFRTWRVW
jgi:hypothetical protein